MVSIKSALRPKTTTENATEMAERNQKWVNNGWTKRISRTRLLTEHNQSKYVQESHGNCRLFNSNVNTGCITMQEDTSELESERETNAVYNGSFGVCYLRTWTNRKYAYVRTRMSIAGRWCPGNRRCRKIWMTFKDWLTTGDGRGAQGHCSSVRHHDRCHMHNDQVTVV